MARTFFASQICVISYPELIDPDKGRNTVNKKHNEAVKDAMAEALEHHRKNNVPLHFRFGAHAKYKYKKRAPETLLIKSKMGKRYLDLVMSGKAKRKFTRDKGRLRRGGNTYSGVGAVNVTLTISWPQGYYDNPNAKPGSIRKRDMVDEIERWTEQEKVLAAKRVRDNYIKNMEIQLAGSPRIRKKYSSKLAAQGIRV